jgi:hypothetical protein
MFHFLLSFESCSVLLSPLPFPTSPQLCQGRVVAESTPVLKEQKLLYLSAGCSPKLITMQCGQNAHGLSCITRMMTRDFAEVLFVVLFTVL